METQAAQITPDGILVLPEELRNYLKDSQDLPLSWNDELSLLTTSRKRNPSKIFLGNKKLIVFLKN